jgi:hypothetical protein
MYPLHTVLILPWALKAREIFYFMCTLYLRYTPLRVITRDVINVLMSEPHLCKQGTPQEGGVDKDRRSCGRSITIPLTPTNNPLGNMG